MCSLDGGTPSPCISAFEADVGDGEHTFAVSAAIGKSVDDTPATHTWRVDATAPDTTLVMGPPALDNTVDPAIEFTGTDPAAARSRSSASSTAARSRRATRPTR